MLLLLIFLSHEPPNGQSLIDHLKHVADEARRIAKKSRFSCPDIAFYAGLFHDLGKLNPYYQEVLFTGKKPDETTAEVFDVFHSPFSGWIAKNLLEEIQDMSEQEKHRTCMLIYGHHGYMRREPGNWSPSKQKQSLKILLDNWKTFVSDAKECQSFNSVNLNIDLDRNKDFFRFGESLELEKKEDKFEAFLQCGYFFSSLLQADRGSFGNSPVNTLDNSFCLDTDKLKKDGKSETTSPLSSHRKSFQYKVWNETDVNEPINVICAPTGAGKTISFLSLVEKYHPERVFYFSPFLTLTDDISKKIKKITSEPDHILIYNHLFIGSLEQDEPNYEQSWNFDYEAFNEKFVITTTVRLLMTIYSDYHKDKMKLASLCNSLLIIDEVQTLPKTLLKNLMSMLKMMSSKMNTKTLLVSATIPDELNGLPTVVMDDDIRRAYLAEKNRKVVLKKDIDPDKIDSKSLVMVNTRRKAVRVFTKLEECGLKPYYITSGIRKTDRDRIMCSIKRDDAPALVSTQVLEAGVDISFKTVWRQLAPLDNIIQVLGRLDRESEHKDSSVAYVFDIDDKQNHEPYSSLEYKLTREMLNDIASSEACETDTSSLYGILDRYYRKIHEQDNTKKHDEKDLDRAIERLDFKEVWDFVQEFVGDNFYQDVYVPDESNWDSCKSALLNGSKSRRKKYEKIKATLPVLPKKLKDCWDEELYAKNILLPKKEKLDDVYDKKLGLDICITRN